jgi:DNA polymerase-3 subunit epsilon
MLTMFLKKYEDYPKEQLDLSIEDICYVVVDTELTGLDPKRDSIVSIGAVKMSGKKISLGDSFYKLVKPQTSLTSDSVVIHGITPSEVEEKPDIESALPEFTAFCKGCVIVGHFVSLDMSFLQREIKKLGRAFDMPVLDTYKIYEWIMGHDDRPRRDVGGNGNKDLFTLAKKYGVEVSDAHNALIDAFITAQLFQRFLSRLPKLGVRTVKDLLRIGKP